MFIRDPGSCFLSIPDPRSNNNIKRERGKNLLSYQKIVTKLSKIWFWDPGPGKNLFRILDPGIKKAPDPDSQHCFHPLTQCFGPVPFDTDPDSPIYLICVSALPYLVRTCISRKCFPMLNWLGCVRSGSITRDVSF
jgi:hypothetical protein